MNADDRLLELETKIAYQEDLLQDLNLVIVRQQRQIDKLEASCRSLADQLKSLADQGGPGAGDERPPHY